MLEDVITFWKSLFKLKFNTLFEETLFWDQNSSAVSIYVVNCLAVISLICE